MKVCCGAIALLGFGMILGAGAPAAAQAGPGSVRMGVSLRVLDITLAPGVGDTLRVDAGLSRETPGFEFGRQFGEVLFFGARTALYLDDLGGENEAFGLTAVPRIELLMGSRERVIPMVGAQMGFSMIASNGDTDAEFLAGGMIGMHIFTAPAFVVSPSLEINYLVNSLRTPNIDNDLLQISLTLTFGGWWRR